MTILAIAHRLNADIVQLRRQLHQHPELGLELPQTQKRVLDFLEGTALEITLGERLSSIGAVLRGGAAPENSKDNPVVLLRGDMDALPIQERTGVPFASQLDGRMHACGHDLHTAMLAGAARILGERREHLHGDVVFMFQPGEEGWHGAQLMIEDGILDLAGRRADAAYGMHVFSGLEDHGVFFTRPGVIMSNSGALHVTVNGIGGHGSAPYRAKDPIPVITEMISALQVAITRKFDVFDPVIASVGVLNSGSAPNIIPETAHFEASVRTFTPQSLERFLDVVPHLLKGIAHGHGVDVDIDYRPRVPLTVNNHDEARFAQQTAKAMFGDARSLTMEHPLSASEDFSRVLDEVPGAFIGLAATSVGADCDAVEFNHSPYAVFDDGVVADGAALYARLAEDKLLELARARSNERAEVMQ